MTQIGHRIVPMRRPRALGVHSMDCFTMAVPDLEENQGLSLRTFGHEHQWGQLREGLRKSLGHLSFGVFEEDLPRFMHGIHGSDHHMVAFAKSEAPGLHHCSWDIDYIPVEMDWEGQSHPIENSFYLWGPEPPKDFAFNHEASIAPELPAAAGI